MKKSFLAILFVGMILMSASAYADEVSITATVGNQAPTITIVEIYDAGGQASDLTPATEFTVEVTVTDPNGASDIDVTSFSVELYTSADNDGGTPDWDAIVDSAVTGSANTCTEAGSTYCLTVDGGDWTTKFLSGNADIYVYVEDNSDASDSDESLAVVTINTTTGFTPDATTGTYSGSPDSTDNVFVSGEGAKGYVIYAHNGNVDIDVTGQQTDLTDGGTETIGDGNISWYLTDNASSSTPFTGGADAINTNFVRGTDPDDETFDLYMYLDIPANQPAGEYTGTLTVLASASP